MYCISAHRQCKTLILSQNLCLSLNLSLLLDIRICVNLILSNSQFNFLACQFLSALYKENII